MIKKLDNFLFFDLKHYSFYFAKSTFFENLSLTGSLNANAVKPC